MASVYNYINVCVPGGSEAVAAVWEYNNACVPGGLFGSVIMFQ